MSLLAKPVVEETSHQLLESIFSSDTHAILLTGEEGVGLNTIAKHFAENIIYTIQPEKDNKIDLEKGIISADSIRGLYDLTKTVSPKLRTIVIDYAERMQPTSQNVFLKLLEEPPVNTRFVLLSHSTGGLLPTIMSRVQKITVRPVSKDQSLNLLNILGVTNDTKKAQLMFIASGLPAELTRLVANEDYFKAKADLVINARNLISGTGYGALILAKKYKDNRSDALVLIEYASKMLQSALEKDSTDSAVLNKINKLQLTHQRLSEQGNIRLQLSSLIML